MQIPKLHGLLTRSYTLRQLTPEDSPGTLRTVSIGWNGIVLTCGKFFTFANFCNRAFWIKYLDFKCIGNVNLNTFFAIIALFPGSTKFNIQKCLEWKKLCHTVNGFQNYYAYNFEEVDGAHWFRVVRLCVRPSVRLKHACHIL